MRRVTAYLIILYLIIALLLIERVLCAEKDLILTVFDPNVTFKAVAGIQIYEPSTHLPHKSFNANVYVTEYANCSNPFSLTEIYNQMARRMDLYQELMEDVDRLERTDINSFLLKLG
jgi:hypothetical protein